MYGEIMITKIEESLNFATQIHAGVQRKYSGLPYIFHPIRVANLVNYYCLEVYYEHPLIKCINTREDVVCAALMHDCIEDSLYPQETKAIMKTKFNTNVVELCFNLTNPSQIIKNFKYLPRTQRKKIDLEHLSKQNSDVHFIKLCDRLDNISDLYLADKDYQILYSNETRDLLEVIGNSHIYLKHEILHILNNI